MVAHGAKPRYSGCIVTQTVAYWWLGVWRYCGKRGPNPLNALFFKGSCERFVPPTFWFGTRGSEVRILSLRPKTFSKTRGWQMEARIYRPNKSAMTSGRGNTKAWVLEFVKPGARRSADPLMGWTSIDDTSGQVRLEFDTQEQAVEYAQREGMTFRVEEARERKRLVKTYSENFAFDRKQPWTH